MLAGYSLALPAFAQEASAPDEGGSRQTIIVIAPGNGFDLDDALTLGRDDIDRAGTPDLLASLTRSFAGVSLQDAQNNPWQPNLVYRGYVASPLKGRRKGWRFMSMVRGSTSRLAIRSIST